MPCGRKRRGGWKAETIVGGAKMAKFCKFDETPSWPCRWQGEPTAEDCINCQLFAIKNTLYRLLRSFEKAKLSHFEKTVIQAVKKLDSRTVEHAVKQATEELVKETEEAVRRVEQKKK